MQAIFIIGRSDKGKVEAIPADQMTAEVDYVRARYADDRIRQVWSRGDVAGAVLLIEAANYEEASAIVASLPLMKSGFLQVESTVPLKPYRAFGASN